MLVLPRFLYMTSRHVRVCGLKARPAEQGMYKIMHVKTSLSCTLWPINSTSHVYLTHKHGTFTSWNTFEPRSFDVAVSRSYISSDRDLV